MYLKNLLKPVAFKIKLKLIVYFSRLHTKVFYSSHGRLMNKLIGLDMLLLFSIGLKTGKTRRTTLLYIEDRGRYLCAASYAGNQSHPNWYYNIIKEPKVSLMLKKERLDAEAHVLSGEERHIAWREMVRNYPSYEKYQNRTSRIIPIIEFRPVGEINKPKQSFKLTQ